MMSLAMVTYLDRACIGALAPDITRDLALSKDQMSEAFGAFALAYAFFEIPTGRWADRVGTRRVLTRIVLWWSAFTMATAAAFGFGSLLTTRFLFGVGEAGAWACVARTFSRWIPVADRGRVQGLFFSGAHLIGGLTPMLAVGLSGLIGWRLVFVLFGLVGVAWTVNWSRRFHDEPAQHPGVNPAEAALILAGRESGAAMHEGWPYWRRLLAHRNTLPLCLSYVPNSCAFYFCITWLPTYLKEKQGFTSLALGLASGLPLLLSVAGDLLGGAATDFVAARFGLRWGRAGVAGAGNVLAGIALIAATRVHEPHVAIGLISVGVAATMFTLGASWATCQDIGGAHVGVVSAAMNMSGQLGAFVCPFVMTGLLDRFGDWNAGVLAIGCFLLLGAACWSFIDPRDRVFE
jgi:MFS family permease